MSIPGSANPLLLASAAEAGAYQIERSVRFNSADSAYLSRTPTSAGNRKTWTFSCWVKRASLGRHVLLSAYINGSDYTFFQFNSSDQLAFEPYTNAITAAVFRDLSAWYHVVCAVNTTLAAQADRVKIYVNGVRQTLSTSTGITQNADTAINSTNIHNIASGYYGSPGVYVNGYLAEVYLIDGQELDPTSFTEVSATTGQLIPKQYTGSFGTNGFWLKFSDNSAATATTLGKDYSGNSNNWTPNNLSVTAGTGNDSLVDTPTSYGTDTGAGGEVRGNYATFGALSGTGTLVNGNLDVTGTIYRTATIGVTSGKWYCEFNAGSVVVNSYVGIYGDPNSLSTYAVWGTGGYFTVGVGSPSNNFSSGTITAGDVIGVAFDYDNGTLGIYRNGSFLGQYSGLTLGSSPWFIGMHTNVSATNPWVLNAGQRPFAYTAPSGFKALCTTNLPAPVVAKSSSAFDVKLYTGTAATQSITGLGFSPDLVWIKQRNDGFYWHNIIDSVRGAAKLLSSNSTNAEDTAKTDSLTSFNSDGFTLGADTIGPAGVNRNAGTHVAWAWDAGSSTVTNTDGSITSTVRANPTAGFSIVTWTGTGAAGSVGHGLNVTPSLWIQKRRDNTGNWNMYHSSTGVNKYLIFTTAASGTISGVWGAGPSPTVMNLSSLTSISASGASYVAYCFAPVAGYSAFGSYTGNGSTDGAFVYTGFRPAFVMLKASSTTGNWVIEDYQRNNYNATGLFLVPNSANAEDTGGLIDFLSNGFKLRLSSANFNGSGVTYIYAAFAESPFAYSRAR